MPPFRERGRRKRRRFLRLPVPLREEDDQHDHEDAQEHDHARGDGGHVFAKLRQSASATRSPRHGDAADTPFIILFFLLQIGREAGEGERRRERERLQHPQHQPLTSERKVTCLPSLSSLSGLSGSPLPVPTPPSFLFSLKRCPISLVFGFRFLQGDPQINCFIFYVLYLKNLTFFSAWV